MTTDGDASNGNVTMTVDKARELAVAIVVGLGVTDEDARIMVGHYLDAELRTRPDGGTVGLSRLIDKAENVSRHEAERDISIERETDHSALVDGGFHYGVVVAERATRLAIEKAKATGIGVVVANNHRNSGTMSYYVEMAAREDLVAMASAVAHPIVAPFGGREARLGSNPIGFGFPTDGDPIVWDITTSVVAGSEMHRRALTGEPLPESGAVDANGRLTRDARAVREGGGALMTWGGHKGSGLAIVLQLLGLLCGTDPFPSATGGWGFFIVVIDPAIFLPTATFKARASELADGIRSTPPAEGFDSVSMPYDRSLRVRSQRLEHGVEISHEVYDRLQTLRSDLAGLI